MNCYGQTRPRTVLITGLALALVTGFTYAQGVTYDSQGKRDPFWNLLTMNRKLEPAKVLAPPPLQQRPPGLAGLLIAEVNVTGTARGPGSQLAILKGIDEISYFAKEGTKLFDGFVESVSGDEVIFVREQVDTRGKKRVTRVTKRMQTEDR